MEDSRSKETEVEVELYEEIVGDLDYSTPITSRSASPNRYEEDRSTVATFQGPITHSSESTVTSASAGLVASVPWPALRSPCSIAGKHQEPRSHMRSDGCPATPARPAAASRNSTTGYGYGFLRRRRKLSTAGYGL